MRSVESGPLPCEESGVRPYPISMPLPFEERGRRRRSRRIIAREGVYSTTYKLEIANEAEGNRAQAARQIVKVCSLVGDWGKKLKEQVIEV